jgi:hypothetical protein
MKGTPMSLIDEILNGREGEKEIRAAYRRLARQPLADQPRAPEGFTRVNGELRRNADLADDGAVDADGFAVFRVGMLTSNSAR